MRRKSSLWKTTAVSLSAMMTLFMGAAVLAAGTEQTTHESQNEDNTENKSADTDEASNTAETKTEECKIELSDNGILVDGETISENTEDSVYAGADIVYYKEGQDSTYGAGDEDDGHSEEEAAEHTVIPITIDYGNSDRVCSWGRSCTGDFNWIYKAVNQAAFN